VDNRGRKKGRKEGRQARRKKKAGKGKNRKDRLAGKREGDESHLSGLKKVDWRIDFDHSTAMVVIRLMTMTRR
jgi:hypothetical protein